MTEPANGRRGALPSGVSSSPEFQQRLREDGYLAGEGLSTAIFLALKLGRPLFLEGEAGVGKTEVAKVLSRMLDTPLIRLQCYEGIDVYQAVYEWDYPRQLLHIRAAEAFGAGEDRAAVRGRTLYAAVPGQPAAAAGRWSTQGPAPPVLLIDEVDRADDEFEAFLLEILSEFAITVPELGTIRADRPPIAVLTSNRTREVHDALKRRCLYFFIDHPTLEREVEIVRLRVPGADEELARQVVAAVQRLRELDLYKPPGVAETLDWTEALVALGAKELDEDLIEATLGSVVKYREDQQRVARGGDEPARGAVVIALETAAHPKTPVLEASVAFGRLLRRAGVNVGTDRVVGFARALEELGRRAPGRRVLGRPRITLCFPALKTQRFYDRAFEVVLGGHEPFEAAFRAAEGAVLTFTIDDSVQPPKKSVEKDSER